MGLTEQIKAVTRNRPQMERYIYAIDYMFGYEKLLYGTDWPLVPMDAYGVFIEGH